MSSYKPTDDEIRTALRAFLRLVLDKTTVFKVGRCQEGEVDTLKNRAMYEGCIHIEPLWGGPAGKVAWLEYALTNLGWKHFPARCLNEQRGGGPAGEDEKHVVYLVLFEPTVDRLADVFFNWTQRELPS